MTMLRTRRGAMAAATGVAFGYEIGTVGNGTARGRIHQRDDRNSLTMHADARDPDP
jgi:hypothetical protein